MPTSLYVTNSALQHQGNTGGALLCLAVLSSLALGLGLGYGTLFPTDPTATTDPKVPTDPKIPNVTPP